MGGGSSSCILVLLPIESKSDWQNSALNPPKINEEITGSSSVNLRRMVRELERVTPSDPLLRPRHPIPLLFFRQLLALVPAC